MDILTPSTWVKYIENMQALLFTSYVTTWGKVHVSIVTLKYKAWAFHWFENYNLKEVTAIICVLEIKDFRKMSSMEGIYFDELSKIRVLQPEVLTQTEELKDECKQFVDSKFVNRFYS